MLQSGVLKPDQHQQQLVQQLSTLLQHLQVYSRAVAGYRSAKEEYNVSFWLAPAL